MVRRRTEKAKIDMFGRPVEGSALSPTAKAGSPGGLPGEPGRRRPRSLAASLPRWVYAVAAAVGLVALLVAAPRVVAAVLIIAVITGLIYNALRNQGGGAAYSDTTQTTQALTNRDHIAKLLGFRARRAPDAVIRPASPWELRDRAEQLEAAAERFKQAGDAKTAASFAAQAAELRRYGA